MTEQMKKIITFDGKELEPNDRVACEIELRKLAKRYYENEQESHQVNGQRYHLAMCIKDIVRKQHDISGLGLPDFVIPIEGEPYQHLFVDLEDDGLRVHTGQISYISNSEVD